MEIFANEGVPSIDLNDKEQIMSLTPDFVQTYYLSIVIPFIEEKLLPEFYKYFSAPRENDW